MVTFSRLNIAAYIGMYLQWGHHFILLIYRVSIAGKKPLLFVSLPENVMRSLRKYQMRVRVKMT